MVNYLKFKRLIYKTDIMKKIYLVLFVLTFFTKYAQDYKGFDVSNIALPISEIKDGGPPKDGIPAIDSPKFLSSSESSLLENERILGVYENGIAKAYPISILNYHEIVNDKFDNRPIVVTYCPLCGSGIAFDAKVGNNSLSFGVSGLLYNSDMLLYDRQTESLWSQLKYEAISGPLVGKKLKPLPTSNTTWADWHKRHPNSLVLSRDTGFNRNYNQNPYPDYDDSDFIYFPINNSDDSYHPKEMVIGITLNGKAKAYPFSELEKIREDFIEDYFEDKFLRVYYNSDSKSAEIRDNQNNLMASVTNFWFAWFAFHPNTSVFTTK